MTDAERIIKDVEKHGSMSSGRAEYMKILQGQKISLLAPVKAKCYDCCGYYEDGREDCGVETCPIYAWMPFGKARKNREKKQVSQSTLEALARGREKRGGITTPQTQVTSNASVIVQSF